MQIPGQQTSNFRFETTRQKSPPNDFRTALYCIANASARLDKELQSFYRRKLGIKVRLVVIHSTFGIGNRFRYKDKQPLLHRNTVVYKLNCSCGASYVGQHAQI